MPHRRGPLSFPCSMVPWRRRVRRHVSGTELFSEIAQLASGLRQMREKTSRFPDLKLEPVPDESDLRGNARIGFGAFAQDHPSLRIYFQNLAGAKEGRGKQVALLRIGRKLAKKIVNFAQQGMTPAIECFLVKRGMHIKTVEAVAREHRPERRRNRDAPLGIEPAGAIRDKSVHSQPHPRGFPRAWPSRPLARRIAPPGVQTSARENLGYHGNSWASMELQRHPRLG